MIIDTIKILKAEEGYKLTDGEIIAETVLLPENRDIKEFKEITIAEAEAIEQKEQEEFNVLHK